MLLGVIVAGLLAQADTASLDQVLVRAQAYVLEFQKQLAGIVAEEAYTQDFRSFRLNTLGSRPGSGRRTLKSDLLLVKPQGSTRWLQFRDVFEVDGRAVQNRTERLMELFVNPSTATRTTAERITAESARYNVGPIERNINVPMLALTVLLPENFNRFQFKRTTKGEPFLIRGRAAADALVVELDETRRPTLVHGVNNSDMPVQGRLWIEPSTGRVLMTELALDSNGVRATIDVAYGAGPAEGMLVPLEMRELYEQTSMRVEGIATYGKFRQFQVTVDEQIAPVKK